MRSSSQIAGELECINHPQAQSILSQYILAVTEVIVETLLALPVLFLWLAVVSVLVRPFGTRLPLAPPFSAKRRSAFQALTFSQYLMVCGVLCFGCGMLIVTTFFRHIEWKYLHGSALTTESLLRDAFQYPLLSGGLFGMVGWFTRNGNGAE